VSHLVSNRRTLTHNLAFPSSKRGNMKKEFWDYIPSYEDEWGWLKWGDPVHAIAGPKCGLSVRLIHTPAGDAYSLHLGVEITDEKVLEKLRSIKGQEPFVQGGIPIFWHENVAEIKKAPAISG
jgi:hypothetical protein